MLSTLRCGYSVKSPMYALDEYGRLCLALYPFFFVGTGMEGGGGRRGDGGGEYFILHWRLFQLGKTCFARAMSDGWFYSSLCTILI